MVADRDRIGSFWDERAREDALYFVDNRRSYGERSAKGFWSDGRRDLDAFLDALGVSVEAGSMVVDIGCGVGRLTRELAARASRVLALDVSAEMLALGRRLNAGMENVEWIQGDGVSLAPVPDSSVDACLSYVVFQHLPDPEITLGYVREMGRVLRPGGWAAFQVSNDPEVHRPRRPSLRRRLARIAGRGPRGQGEPPWLGSAVELDQLRAACEAGSLSIERLVGEGTQFCLVLARRG